MPRQDILRSTMAIKTPALSDLEYFTTVVSEGSLTQAARKLRVQQSTLTMAIQRLEAITGSSLLVRARHGVQPTQAGKVFLERSKVLLEGWYGLTGELSGKKKQLKTRFSLGCHQSTGRYCLKQFLPAFLHQHPELEITVQHDYTSAIIEDVLRYRLDFGLAVNPTPHQELVVIPLYRTFFGLWNSSTTNLGQDILLYDPHMYGIELVMAQLEKSRHTFARYLTIASLDTIAALVLAGAGRAILPADTACSLGASPLTLIWEPAQMPELRICLIYRKDIHQSYAASLFVQSAKKTLGDLQPGVTKRKNAKYQSH